MAVELWLVRHGQAAFGTGDYDRLTELGRQQSVWLGEHLARMGTRFDRICAGTLRRQQETAEAITGVIGGEVETIPGFEEYDARRLMARVGQTDQDPNLPRREHFRRLRRLLNARHRRHRGSRERLQPARLRHHRQRRSRQTEPVGAVAKQH